MDVVEYILDGLEAALELERELGVRVVECDRAVLAGETRPAGGARGSSDSRGSRISSVQSGSNAQPAAVNRTLDTSNPQTLKPSNTQTLLPLAFLHDRPLSEKGVEMMAKILNAMGRPDAPIVVVPPAPQARVTVVLGGLALRKYFPGMRGEPGQWQKTPEGRDVLITYSPEYILRFGFVTPAVQKMKKDMWTSLKAVVQRCNQQ